MYAVTPLTHRNLDQLEQDIVSLSQRINASEYEMLVLVREFDLRQGWKAYHFNNCAEWLNMKCGIAPGTAREKIRVANALFDLPLTSCAFESGELSYSKARALTRVATPKTESGLLDYAIPATAQQVDDHCRKLRNVQRDLSSVDAQRLHNQRYLSRSCHTDGSMTISVELPREQGELVIKALEMALAELEQQEAGESIPAEDEKLQARQADALVQVAQSYLAGGPEKSSCTADHYQVMVHVDEEALRGEPTEKSKSDLPIETVRRLCCDSAIVAVKEDAKGNPLKLSRKHRVVQPALKRALLARDKCCRYPGCTHEKWLDAQGLPLFLGTTWCIGRMVARLTWITPFCFVRNTIGCCTRAHLRSEVHAMATLSSSADKKAVFFARHGAWQPQFDVLWRLMQIDVKSTLSQYHPYR